MKKPTGKQSYKGILKDQVCVNSQLISTYVLLCRVPGVHLSHLPQWTPFTRFLHEGHSVMAQVSGDGEWCVCDGQYQELEWSCALQGMYVQTKATGETGIWCPAIRQAGDWVQSTLYWVNAFCERLQLKLKGPSTHKHTQARAVHMFCYWCEFWTFVLSLVSRQNCLFFPRNFALP